MACCQTLDFLPKIILSEISLALGRQCKIIQFFLTTLSNFSLILKLLKCLSFSLILTLSFIEITLSVIKTSALDAPIKGLCDMVILPLFLLIYLIKFILGEYFLGQIIFNLKFFFIEASS